MEEVEVKGKVKAVVEEWDKGEDRVVAEAKGEVAEDRVVFVCVPTAVSVCPISPVCLVII